jgi:hypothetical protein
MDEFFQDVPPDKVDDILAASRPRDERERREKRKAQERVQAREEARRDDLARAQELDEVRKTRDAARERIERYEEAMAAAVKLLGPSDPASRLLIEVMES